MLYDKNDETFGPWGFLLLIVLCFVLLVLCSGCIGNNDTVADDIMEYQKRIVQLECRNRELEQELGDIRSQATECVREITECREQGQGISDRISNIIREYEIFESKIFGFINSLIGDRTQIVDTSSD